jgi:GntR family transcriptional regulator
MAPHLHLIIVPGDEAPIYRQIMRQIRQVVASGRLRAGDQLPSHRDLGQSLVVAPLTVKKAYDELERAGLVETRRGQGTFVAARRRSVNPAVQLERLRPLARRLAQDAQISGVATTDLVSLVEEEAGRLDDQRARQRTEDDP